MAKEIDYEKKEFFEANSKRFVYSERLKKGCSKCGTHGKKYLQFHHRNPKDKLFDIAWGVGRSSVTREIFDEELAKCDVLCVVCHKRIHKNMNLMGSPHSKKTRLKKFCRIVGAKRLPTKRAADGGNAAAQNELFK